MSDIRELFPTDDPVEPDLLIGRSSDVEDLTSRLESGTHVVLAGPRRIGKSTVALAALSRIRRPASTPRNADLWDYEDLASLTKALAQSIVANRRPCGQGAGSVPVRADVSCVNCCPPAQSPPCAPILGRMSSWPGARRRATRPSRESLGATITLAQRYRRKR